ncbi:oxidoreductase [Shewanella algae]|uniref:oxidoreductase n=1 Tax=Shewanella algae TaxID=38313 RepID=UPI0011821609|nr:HisA/HisF-related TIM barrel protein [Shewanella algae]MDO8253135.1 HisA/HisF-related TIM barrel protein [Shewanella algae]TVL46921.1 oxidoreductase [Shewanella algae]
MSASLKHEFLFGNAGVSLKNRAVLAPLTHNMSAANGDPSQAELQWLQLCIQGGFGMLITAATQVLPGGRCWSGQPALMTEAQQQSWLPVASSAEANQAKVLVQLHHGGLRALPELNAEGPKGPSAIAQGTRYPSGVAQLQDEEIRQLIQAFINSAERAYAAGLHGVELHAAHHFLLCNFLNPEVNRREDIWGGSSRNRARIIIEIIRGIRQRLPRSFLIGVRLSPESYANVSGIRLANQLEVANLLAEEALDYLHFSMGNSFKQANEDKQAGPLLTQIRQGYHGHVPLMFAGAITDIHTAERAFNLGAELVAIGSAAIGNPDWLKRSLSGAPLKQAPFSREHLLKLGFTEQALEYLVKIPALTEQAGKN